MSALALSKVDARLDPIDQFVHEPTPHPHSWFISHGYGGPAQNTYTEVVMPVVEDDDGAPLPEDEQQRIGSDAVRTVAVKLYGTAWAFIYPPNEYGDAIKRWSLRRRELVVIENVELHG